MPRSHQERVLAAFPNGRVHLDRDYIFRKLRITKNQRPYYTGLLNTMVRVGQLHKATTTGKYHLPPKHSIEQQPVLDATPAETSFRPAPVVAERDRPETVEEFLRRGGKITRLKGIERYTTDLKRNHAHG